MYDSLGPLFVDLFEAQLMGSDYISIFNHVRHNLDSSGVGLTDGGEALPDDYRYQTAGLTTSFAPGAREAVIAYHHNVTGNNLKAVRAIVAAAKAFGESGARSDLRTLYTTLIRDEMVTVIDEVLAALNDLPDETLSGILRAGMAFFYGAPDRGPVKFGISVIGHSNATDLLNDLKLIARHEEFSIYAAVAVEKLLDQPQSAVFDMARSVTGWGRIELVYRLAGWNNKIFSDWLVRGGFHNTVLDEYLAFAAATDGKLLLALRNGVHTDDLLESAGEIITALIRGGPGQDMTEYDDGAAVVELYLEALTERQISIRQFVSLFEIQDFVNDIDIEWDTRMTYGWTPRRCESINEKVVTLIHRANVSARVQSALLSSDKHVFETALEAADLLDLEVWDIVFARVSKEPSHAICWFDAARHMSLDTVDQLVSLARSHMDVKALGTGAAMETGLGTEFGPHDALMFLVRELSRFPKKGWDLVEVALKSPIIPCRWTAVSTIDMWAHVSWTEEMARAMNLALTLEVSDDLRDYMEQVIQLRTN